MTIDDEKSSPASIAISAPLWGRDVRNQIAHGRAILDQVRQLTLIRSKIGDAAVGNEIDNVIAALIKIADQMSVSVATTTSVAAAASGTLGSVIHTISGARSPKKEK